MAARENRIENLQKRRDRNAPSFSFELFENCRRGRVRAGPYPSPAIPERGISMQYQVEENCLTIFLPPEVDHHNAGEIRREADRIVREKHIRHIIFDFRDTSFMDSSGIGVIMGRYRNISLIGGDVWAAHANPRMKKILTMSGVTKIMQLYDEEEETYGAHE